jgi:hypothetical protein
MQNLKTVMARTPAGHDTSKTKAPQLPAGLSLKFRSASLTVRTSG